MKTKNARQSQFRLKTSHISTSESNHQKSGEVNNVQQKQIEKGNLSQNFSIATLKQHVLFEPSKRQLGLKKTSIISTSQQLSPRDFPFKPVRPIDQEDFDQLVSTPYDDQMFSNDDLLNIYLEYKHKCNTPKYLQMERIQKFIYDKKSKNKLKYSAQSRINQTALPVPNGSVSIMLNVTKKNMGFNLQAFKKKIPARSKFKMKWKTIQWLLNNRKDAIKQIFQNYQMMVKFAKNKKNGMNREEFGELLSSVGLGADLNLGDKLFYVFDEDGSSTVDYKELIVGLELLKEDTIEEKMKSFKLFFDLCDEDNSGKVSEEEIINIFKQNMLSSHDITKLKLAVRQMFKEIDLNGDGELDKEELLFAAKNNIILRQLLEETIANVKRIDNIIENDLEEPFHQFVPVSANFVNYKEGIHFPTVNNILHALEQMEEIDQKCKSIKKIYTKYQKDQNANQYGGLQENILEVSDYNDD